MIDLRTGCRQSPLPGSRTARAIGRGRLAFSTAALVGLLLAAASCGGGSDDGNASPVATPTPTAAAPPTPTAVAAQARVWALAQAAGERVLIRSDDGGWTWSAPLLAGPRLTAPSFIDPERGLIADGARFWHTGDGGDTWQHLQATIDLPPQIFEPPTASVVYDGSRALVMIDEARAIAVGVVTFPDFEPAADDAGVVLVSDDGGRSWQGTHLGLPYGALCATTTGIALARGANAPRTTADPYAASVEASSDGGASWSTVAYQSSVVPGAVHVGTPVCGESASAWLVGSRPGIPSGNVFAPEILHSPDAGATWLDQSGNVEPALFQASISSGSFAVKSVGWAVGGALTQGGATAPVILRTTDGGARWQVQRAPDVQGGLTSVVALDELRAVAAGAQTVDTLPMIQQALVLVTEDDGATWTSVRLPREIESVSAVVAAR